MTFDLTTTKYIITAISPADVGIYTVTTTATIPQVDPVTGFNRILSYSFTLTVLHECLNTVLTDKTINDMATQVFAAGETQDMSIFDSIATLRGISNYCGARSYSFSPILNYLTLSGTTLTL